MLTPYLIKITKERIDDSLIDLRKEISIFERNENAIHLNVERLNAMHQNSIMSPTGAAFFDLIATLTGANERLRTINQRSIREIDNNAAFISGNITVLLDYIISNYSTDLKVWIRGRIRQLNEMRTLVIAGAKYNIVFPTAVALLTPYLIKTRTCEKETMKRLVSIRSVILSLSEIFY